MLLTAHSPPTHTHIWQVLFKDLDGTLTGLDGGGWVTADSELYPPQYCTKSIPEFSVNTAVPGSRCTPDVYFLRMAWNRAEPLVWVGNKLV